MKNINQLLSKELKQKREKSKFSFTHKLAFFSNLIGAMILIVAFSILDGYQYYLREKSALFSSHIKIEYLKPNNQSSALLHLQNSLLNSEEYKSYLVTNDEVLIRHKGQVEGILIKEYPTIPKVIKEAFKIGNLKEKEIIIGKELANKFNLKENDSVLTIKINKSENGFSSDYTKRRIAGIFQAGFSQYESNLAFALQDTILAEKNAYLELYLTNLDKLRDVAQIIRKKLNLPYYISTYEELNSGMLNWIEIQKEPIPIILSIVSIVAILNSITSLIVLVIEKSKSVGIMRSFGTSNRMIIFQFLKESMKLSMVGIVTGVIFGYSLVTIQDIFQIVKIPSEIYYLDALPIKKELYQYVLILILGTVLSFLSVLIPSFILIRIKTLKAIKFN
jgi:lipoprotein-releasing system permease protein